MVEKTPDMLPGYSKNNNACKACGWRGGGQFPANTVYSSGNRDMYTEPAYLFPHLVRRCYRCDYEWYERCVSDME